MEAAESSPANGTAIEESASICSESPKNSNLSVPEGKGVAAKWPQKPAIKRNNMRMALFKVHNKLTFKNSYFQPFFI
jgi:hypothetical protein